MYGDLIVRRDLVILLLVVAVAVAIVGSSGNVVEDECVKEEKGKVIKDKAEEKAAETGREAKEASESWAEWAKEKITEGLGFKATKEAKDATAIAITMHTKDEISGIYLSITPFHYFTN